MFYKVGKLCYFQKSYLKQSSKGISESVQGKMCDIYCKAFMKRVTITNKSFDRQKMGKKAAIKVDQYT